VSSSRKKKEKKFLSISPAGLINKENGQDICALIRKLHGIKIFMETSIALDVELFGLQMDQIFKNLFKI
jgi:hypothetical protein